MISGAPEELFALTGQNYYIWIACPSAFILSYLSCIPIGVLSVRDVPLRNGIVQRPLYILND